jgi:hypothetical protein
MYCGITTMSALVCSTTGGRRMAKSPNSMVAEPTTDMKNASLGGTWACSTRRSLTAPR